MALVYFASDVYLLLPVNKAISTSISLISSFSQMPSKDEKAASIEVFSGDFLSEESGFERITLLPVYMSNCFPSQ